MSNKKSHARQWQRRDVLKTLGAWATVGTASKALAESADSRFQLASFRCDVTCPVGHPLLGGLYADAKSIADPLFAHGIVLLSDEQPLVFCTVDWCEIRNQSYDLWRDALAKAANTSRERVLVTSVHQHDAPVSDLGAARYLESVGLGGAMFDPQFEVDCVQRASKALTESLRSSQPVTHIGLGQAVVQDIASNRRVVGADGVVHYGRASKVGDRVELMDAPEGQIDPLLKMLTFWSGETPLVALSTYACHPMSYYGHGEVSSDFVGHARSLWQQKFPTIHHLYACGCSGNVVAGKYNDGSRENRPVLASRLATAMKQAWENTSKQELKTLTFRSVPLKFSFRQSDEFTPAAMKAALQNKALASKNRVLAAMGLSSWDRVEAGQPIDFCSLDFGPAKLVLFPAEAFVEFQLKAQQMCPDQFVMSIGYGECWPGYILPQFAVEEKFTNIWNWVSTDAEKKLHAAMKALLEAD